MSCTSRLGCNDPFTKKKATHDTKKFKLKQNAATKMQKYLYQKMKLPRTSVNRLGLRNRDHQLTDQSCLLLHCF